VCSLRWKWEKGVEVIEGRESGLVTIGDVLNGSGKIGGDWGMSSGFWVWV